MTTEREYQFDALIEEGRGGGAWVVVPFDVREEFGTGGQVRINATFDEVPYRGSIAPMGGGIHVLGIRKAIRAELGKGIGESVRVTLKRDIEERTIDVPIELRDALEATEGARDLYDSLAFTHRRELAEWVGGAKKPSTRSARAQRAVERVLAR